MRHLVISGFAALALLAPQDLDAQRISADPTYGDVELEAGFWPDPHTVSLTAGGSRDVDIGECTYGQVAEAPDVDLYYTASGGTTLYIYAESDDDTTLLVNTPDGVWHCNDDGLPGRNPILVLPKAQSGLYNIWVGTYGSDMVRARLHISEIDPR